MTQQMTPAAKMARRTNHKIRSENRSDDELDSFLRGLAKEGLDLEAHFTVSKFGCAAF